MDSYRELIEGYKSFRHRYLRQDFDAYQRWAATTQRPRTMIIGCSDCRVNPSILTHAGLGDIFAANNVANIVPPFETGRHSHLSIGAAVQFAVTRLEVEHIIIMAHSGCGGVRALMSLGEAAEDTPADDYIQGWVNIIREAKDAVLSSMAHRDLEEQCKVCEMEGALVSLANLMQYPYVRAALEKGTLDLHAWYFHIESGELLSYNFEKGRYLRLVRPH
ncbi:carbonic anhydrase [Sneathiella chungangensis]|uniref:carbonic anhydrase n=1 Tax=Sneathiella chungangensis TaxID=1418234 RepID=A0A845M9C3_9PROT|nr:carbonic anhydrase [Sneathiella chungangensis]MZR20905.1 carbonic anhydrase [Sneathiella chungangensis]